MGDVSTSSFLILLVIAAGVWAAFILRENALVLLLGSAALFLIALISFMNDGSTGLTGFCVIGGITSLIQGIYRVRQGSDRTEE